MKDYLPYLTIIGSVIAFCFTVFKYIDTQKATQENIRFTQFNKVFEQVAGRTMDGKTLVNTQQAMAVYQLAEFKEYKEISLPILNYYIEQTKNEEDNSLFRASLLSTASKLK